MSKSLFERARFKLELVPDPDMYILWKKYKGTRGRICYISNRYSKANTKYLKSYDPKQESKRIIYLDVNNLHSYAKSQFLPTSGFKWIDPNEFNLKKYTSKSSKGYVHEVDLEYSKELHELGNDYSLAPDKIEINREISEYQYCWFMQYSYWQRYKISA